MFINSASAAVRERRETTAMRKYRSFADGLGRTSQIDPFLPFESVL